MNKIKFIAHCDCHVPGIENRSQLYEIRTYPIFKHHAPDWNLKATYAKFIDNKVRFPKLPVH